MILHSIFPYLYLICPYVKIGIGMTSNELSKNFAKLDDWLKAAQKYIYTRGAYVHVMMVECCIH